MKNEEKEKNAFLKSITGTTPLKKKHSLKESPLRKAITPKTKSKTNTIQKNKDAEEKKTVFKKNNSIYKIEKTQINKKLKKRKMSIDKRIDFHGLSLHSAHDLFVKTIINCYEKQMRCILFITGKGVLRKNKNDNEDTKLYYGKIRGSFFSWTKKQELQKYILGVEQASIEYGADGAFFVYLRKKKLFFN